MQLVRIVTTTLEGVNLTGIYSSGREVLPCRAVGPPKDGAGGSDVTKGTCGTELTLFESALYSLINLSPDADSVVKLSTVSLFTL
jgi:hypothetical protein